MLNVKGPLLLAANHPNSFLDAILLSALFRQPVHSLARGDAFATKFFKKILYSLNMLPVYRVSEGVENLESNYTTFDKCQQLFIENKVVLIFSEGRCINEWHLRPLKKGTARLAMAAWQLNLPLKVLPLGFNYSSFKSVGKEVHLNFGEFIQFDDMYEDLTSGKAIVEFNEILKEQLKGLVYEIPKDDKSKLQSYFSEPSLLKRIFLAIPAAIGFVLNVPLYFLFHMVIKKSSFDHYDSVMAGLMFLLYPVYIILVTGVVILFTGNWWYLGLLGIMALTGICLIHFKKSKIFNF